MGKPDAANPLKDIGSSLGDELEGRRVVLCVTGSVASIEVPALARVLIRHGAEVNVVMSEAAERLVRPETLQWATGNPVVRKLSGETEHVRLAGEWEGRADLVLIAPCTANTISKIALGIDDTPVTTMASMALGGGIPLIVCPAAHEPMYRNPAVRANVLSLEERGVEFVGPRYEEEKAKMATVDEIVDAVIRRLSVQDLRGTKVMVSGGPTVEFIDPVRVITNLSSGKMGLALAKEAWRRGAEVFYVFGGSLYPPAQIKSKKVSTTGGMMKAVLEELSKARYDIFISAAAPSDFAPVSSAGKKLRTNRGTIRLALKPTPKIVEEVRKRMPDIYLVAFKAETPGSPKELRSAIRKFKDKVAANVVVGNDVSGGKSFGTDTNSVVILGRRRAITSGEQSKDKIARILLDEVVADQKPRR
jgi:phosphopantothenoylcysteine decarboxylase/phosphopantothenate--cysteine ligase